MAVETVRPATDADVPALSASLGLAFEDDPIWRWAIKPRRRFAERIGTLMGIEIGFMLERGEVWMSQDATAAAVWAAPGRWKVPTSAYVPHLAPALRAAGLRSVRSFSMLARLEKHHATEPHWYLALLGTAPASQGRGLGSAVLAPVLARCDTEGVGAYLESSKAENIPFYARHGFEVVEEVRPAATCPPLWTMWRDPRPR